MYRNFICYRGGSSAGILFAEDIYHRAKADEAVVGKTYYSLCKEDKSEIRNFLNDPKAYLGSVENFVMLLTKDFLDGFLIDGQPNPNSVTRIEIDEALKNRNIKFIPVVFPDFSWEGETNGLANKEILTRLWGEDAMRKIIGSPPIQFVFQYKKQVIECIVNELDSAVAQKEADDLKFNGMFTLKSTPSVIPKSVFCGRDEILESIKQTFDSGERVLFLQGIGGIGKTEIIKQYAKRNKDCYDTIIFATYSSTIVELISSQSAFKTEPIFPRRALLDGSQEDDISYFRRKLDLIRELTNERTLIMIDNFDATDDAYFPEMLNADYKLLITTRCDYSRSYPVIKIAPLDSLEDLKKVFLQNYQGYMVEEDDERLGELIELVNRHTYTIELLAQHMENSGQTVAEMIDALNREGIVSLNEEIHSSVDRSLIAYENLLRIFKVFNLTDEEKRVLQFLSLMPLSGVNVRDFKNWMDLKSLKIIKDLENRSWIVARPNGIALHPIIRDVVRYELPLNEHDAGPFLAAFNETIKEEKSWHYTIDVKNYYADIAAEVIGVFNSINEDTVELYKNTELLFSFAVKPARAVELAADLYRYFRALGGEHGYLCGYAAFQAGWTYLFNMQFKDAVPHAKEWFDRSYEVLRDTELHAPEEYAVYAHLLGHLARVYLVMFRENKDEAMLAKAMEYAQQAIRVTGERFGPDSPFYTRVAVSHMQLADVYIAYQEYEKALALVERAYDIWLSLFGTDDPDTLHALSRKSKILYFMGRYEEALAIGQKNVDVYTRFYGELNYLRFEQLMIVLRCHKALHHTEELAQLKPNAVKIGQQLLAENSEQLKELQEL